MFRLFLLLLFQVPVVTEGYLLGCYRENREDREFKINPSNYDFQNLIPGDCMTECSRFSYEYAGLYAGRFCFCSQTLTLPKDGDGACDVQCSGKAGVKCGSHTHLSVYKVVISMQNLTVNAYPRGYLKTSTEHLFQVSANSDSMTYQVDKGDGTGRGEWLTSLNFTLQFPIPGVYAIHVHATDVNKTFNQIAATTGVSVLSPVGRVDLSCPNLTATFEEVECTASVYTGTSVSASIEFGNEASQTILIPDPLIEGVGPVTPEGDPSRHVSTSDFNRVIPSAEVHQDSYVTEFEYMAIGTGTVTFKILEPYCDPSEHIYPYCYSENSCSPSCQIGNSCMASDIYCHAGNKCTSSVSTTCNESVSQRYSSIKAPTGYRLKHSVTENVCCTGYQILRLNQSHYFKLKKGDILGYESDKHIIAVQNITDDALTDFKVLGGSQVYTQTNLTAAGTQSMVRAIVTSPTSVKFSHTFADVGNKTIRVKLQTKLIASSAEVNATMMVTDGINDTTIVGPDYVAVNQSATFRLLPHSGNGITYAWNINGTLSTTSYPFVTHEFRKAGSYVIMVKASNAISDRENETVVVVREAIEGLVLSGPNIVGTGEENRFNMSVVSGDAYVCVWEFGDSKSFYTHSSNSSQACKAKNYTYTDVGYFDVTVTCINEISNASTELAVVAIKRITDVKLDKEGAEIGQPIFISFTYSGSNATFALSLNGQNFSVFANETMQTGISTKISSVTSYGNLPLVLTATNALGTFVLATNFSIEKYITNVRMFVDQNVTSLNNFVMFTVSADDGTSVCILFDYGDGENETVCQPSGEQWPSNSSVNRTHLYSTPDCFNTSVVVSNPITRKILFQTVYVLNKVANITLKPVSPVKYLNGKGLGEISFIQDPLVSLPVLAVYEYSIDNKAISGRIEYTGQGFTIQFGTPGSFHVSVTISNPISFLVVNTSVEVLRPIENIVLQVDPPHSKPSENVTVKVSMDAGDNVTLFWTYGNGQSDIVQNSEQEVTKIQQYAAVGTYDIIVRAEDAFSNVTLKHRLHSQHPVLDNFTVSHNSPVLLPGQLLNMNLTYPGSLTIPTNASVTLDWNNGDIDILELNFGHQNNSDLTMTLDKNYSTGGIYLTRITVENKVSKINFTQEVEAYSVLCGQLNVNIQPEINGQKRTFIEDKEVEISVEPSCGGGPVKTTDMIAESGDVRTIHYCQSEGNRLKYRFPVGHYNITVNGSNPFSSIVEKNIAIQVVRGITGLRLRQQDKVSKPNQKKEIIASMDAVSPDSCLIVDWGDGSRCNFFGSLTTCQGNQSSIECDYVGNISNPMKISHIYTNEGEFTVNATGFSKKTHTEKFLEFMISNVDCNKPDVTIQDGTSSLFNKRRVMRKDRFTIVGILTLRCRATSINEKTWTMAKVNPSSGETIENIDLTGLISSKSATLVVPSKFLPYGVYEIALTVRMGGVAALFQRRSRIFIEIIESPLVVGLLDGAASTVYRGHGSVLRLDAKANTIDPDDTNETFTFEFYCKRENETFPKTTNGSLNSSIASSPQSLEEFQNMTTCHGGCFCQGPGRIDVAGVESGILKVNTSIMQAGVTYEICAYARKNSREQKGSLRVRLVPGDPPSVGIKCARGGLCKRNECGQRINPSHRLALIGKCREKCVTSDLEQYTWDMSKWVDGAWKSMADFDYYVSDLRMKSIAIEPGLFEKYYEVEKFRLGLSLTISAENRTGVTYLTLCTNKPPVNGTCHISSPDRGILVPYGSFMWNISCTGWKDPENEGIAEYKFFVRHSDEITATQVMFGQDSDVSVQLPIGKINTNYTMELMASVTDIFGATTRYSMGSVQVKPPPTQDIRETVRHLLSSDTSELTNILNSGNMKKTSNTVLMLASQLNSLESQQKTNTDKEDDAKMRTLLLSKVEELSKSMSNMADIAQVSAAIKSTVEKTDEVSRDGQKQSSRGITIMVDLLANLSQETAVEELVAQAEAIVSAISDVTLASNQHMVTPLQFDIQSVEDQQYYDTDLDSDDEWLTGTVDEAAEGLLMETNTKEQRSTASNVVQDAKLALQKLCLAIARSKVASENATKIETAKLSLHIDKNPPSVVSNRSYSLGEAFIAIPLLSNLCATCGTNELVTFITAVEKSPPFLFIKDSEVSSDSQSVSIDLYEESGAIIPIEKTEEDIEIKIPRNRDKAVAAAQYIEPIMANNSWSHLAYHRFYANNTRSSIHVEVQPDNSSVSILVLIKHQEYPNLTTGNFDYSFLLPLENSKMIAGQDPYTAFIESVEDRTGLYRIGVRQLSDGERADFFKLRKGLPFNAVPFAGRFTTNYTIRTYTTGCYFEKGLKWEKYGCKVGVLTTINTTQCLCNHLTTFAGGWIVQPNPIDFNYVFANMSLEKNPTIYATIGVIFALYIMVAIWARHKDKKDVEKIGVTPLPDNDPNDKYLYEVVVFTGLRKNAGTDSRVHIIFSGDEDETDVRILKDPKRKVLRRGGIDSFLMAVPEPLGDLNYARVWHDNSGKGKFGSWYLKYIMVLDLQTKRKYYFISNEWFAVEESDGQVDRLLPVAGKEQMTAFGHMFTKTSQKDLGDGHLWFSVIARPPKSRFTRLQRVSCCLSLLFLTMLTNAMFYERAENPSNSFNFGPFTLSPEQISIGVMSNLIVFPVSLFLVTLFRKSRPRRKRPSRISEAMKYNAVANSMVDINSTAESRPSSSFTEVEVEMPLKSPEKKQGKKKFELPWWCIIPSWIVLWLSVFASGTFVLFYGITWGDEKTRAWITSMVISFFMSVFFTQPLKVILLAAFFALVIKNPSTEEEEEGEQDEEEPQLSFDEQWLHKKDPSYGAAKPRKIAYKPPEPSVLEAAREKRLKEIKMFDILREIIFYVIFLWLLIVVSHSNRDPNAYKMKEGLEKFFISPPNNPNAQFKKIIKTDSFYTWLKEVFIPGVRASTWYNGGQPLFHRGYFDDRVSRIMGHATIRQLRIREENCRMSGAVASFINNCKPTYSSDIEEMGTFRRGWSPASSNETDNAEYIYHTAGDLDGYTYAGELSFYSGGGYIVRLTGSESLLQQKIERLEKEAWIDRRTRAVFVEFTVYNAYVNLFGVSTLLAEFPHSGGVLTSYRFEPVRLLNYVGSAMLFQIVCEVSFVVFVIFFMVKEIRNVMRQKKSYFSYFWNWVEMMIVVFSIISIGIYIYRLVVADNLTTRFKETRGNAYMKFQYIGTWNELLTYFIGFLVFLSTVKFLKLFRFNKRMSILGSTLSLASKSLLLFMIMFTIIFMAFLQLFYFLLGASLLDYSTIPRCFETCIVIILGKFQFYELRQTSDVAVVFFFIYMVTVVMVLVNMLLSILMESFTAVKSDLSKQSNDYEMVDFLVTNFKSWTGLWNSDPKKHLPETDDVVQDTDSPSFIQGQVDNFPFKVERLLQSISKVYFEQDKYDTLFHGVSKNDAFAKQALKMILRDHYLTGAKSVKANKS